MPQILFVRSNYGQFTPQFLEGGYVAIGWLAQTDLKDIVDRNELYPLYRQSHPKDTSNVVVGQQVGQISRFLHELRPGDYVLTQSTNSDHIHYGVVSGDYYFESPSQDGCPFPHRKSVRWHQELPRNQFSVPFQNTIRSSLTVFKVSQKEDFFHGIGKAELAPKTASPAKVGYHRAVLNQIMELDATEFEVLLTHLLAALGFERTLHTGGPHDGGVDATGELDVAGMAKIKVFVQAKRYKLDAKIKPNDVKALRQNIPRDGQGTFITTAQYHPKCKEIALDPNFPRIGLINGNQLVDLLAEHWQDIPSDFQEKLNLRLGLVPK